MITHFLDPRFSLMGLFLALAVVSAVCPSECVGDSFTNAALITAVAAWCTNSTAAFEVYGNITTWCVGDVTYMGSLFSIYLGCSSFNDDIGCWDVSSVTTMGNMFFKAEAFNKDISGWDVSSVEDSYFMFEGATAFNQDIGGWDVSSVTNMYGMFFNASAFNQDLGGWDVSSVFATNFDTMFKDAAVAVDTSGNKAAICTDWKEYSNWNNGANSGIDCPSLATSGAGAGGLLAATSSLAIAAFLWL